jgi:hypothetical protein
LIVAGIPTHQDFIKVACPRYDGCIGSIIDMSKLARGLIAFVALTIWAYVASLAAVDGTVRSSFERARVATFDASTLASALPDVLVPPAVPAERLVAMVANDIDADGDLDVIANDGSLQLVVWINDGTGHLVRREARRTSGLRPDRGGPGFAADPIGSPAALHSLASFVAPRGSISSVLASRSRPRSGLLAALPPVFVSNGSPRAPPSFDSLS